MTETDMSSNIWFTADTHFGHTNVIEFCDRPFRSVHEMNMALIQDWQMKVKPGDRVYHLGDFAMGADPELILRQLPGQIFLIAGNHDKGRTRKCDRWVTVSDYKEISVPIEGVKKKIVMCHYAMETWNGSHRGSWMLHGHSHGTMPPRGRRLDVGVDGFASYELLSLTDVERWMKTREFAKTDYHEVRR